MADDIIAAGKDAYSLSTAATTPHAEPKRPKLQSGVAAVYVFLPCKRKVAGKSVSSAIYSVPVRGSVAGQTTTVARVTSAWSPSALTWNNAPSVAGSPESDVQPALSDGQ